MIAYMMGRKEEGVKNSIRQLEAVFESSQHLWKTKVICKTLYSVLELCSKENEKAPVSEWLKIWLGI